MTCSRTCRRNTGMAVVVVQHLDPQHDSKLSSLLSRVSHLPVLEASQGLAVQPDHVYVMPRNMTMTIGHGVLELAPAAGFAARTCRSTCSSSRWPGTSSPPRSA